MELKELKREDLKDAFGTDEREMEEALWFIIQEAIKAGTNDVRAVRLPTSVVGNDGPAPIGILRLLAMTMPRYLQITDMKTPKLVPTEPLAALVTNLFKKPVSFVGGGPLGGQVLMLSSNVRVISVECDGVARTARYRVVGGNEGRLQS